MTSDSCFWTFARNWACQSLLALFNCFCPSATTDSTTLLSKATTTFSKSSFRAISADSFSSRYALDWSAAASVESNRAVWILESWSIWLPNPFDRSVIKPFSPWIVLRCSARVPLAASNSCLRCWLAVTTTRVNSEQVFGEAQFEFKVQMHTLRAVLALLSTF